MMPSTITFLTTYKCTAACIECCFKCSPKNPSQMLSKEAVYDILDQATRDFSSLSLVVFSGGECFLLGETLYKAIAYAAQKKLSTRCVTNGYWGKKRKNAQKMADKLSEVGLTEINISTGDDHQKFVSVQSVINSAIECARKDIVTLIVVEGHEKSHFKLQHLIENEELANFFKNEKSAANLRFIQNIWIPFNEDRILEHPDAIELRNRLGDGIDTGCNQIFNGIAITPDLYVASCCGLTLEYIDELKLGKINENLGTLFKMQLEDFMKIWLFTDGPAKMLEFIKSKDSSLDIERQLVHPCQICAFLYNDIRIKQKIIVHHKEIIEDVLFRFHLKKERIYQKSTFIKENCLVTV